MDSGVWQAIVHEVAQNWTRLKQLRMDAGQMLGVGLTQPAGPCRRKGRTAASGARAVSNLRVATGSASWLSSHGRGLGPRDALKKDSRGLSRGAAGTPHVPRLLPGTLGNFPGCLCVRLFVTP